MRIALVGPFAGPALSEAFEFPSAGGALPPGYPGAQLMCELAKALVQRGHQVAAITTDYSTPIAQLEPFRLIQGRELHAYFCPQRPRSFRSAHGRRGRALDLFRYERDGLRAAISDFAPDVIHAHWTYEFVWAALDSGVPTLATAHDSPLKVLRFMPNLYRLVRYFMARRVLARCRHLTAVSPDLERDLRHLTPAQITVVANPISNAILHAPGCAAQPIESKTLVMVLNGWIALKNGAAALRAFSLARRTDPGLRLVCFGSGYEPGGEAQRWAAAQGFLDGVEFRGPTPHPLVLEQMRSSLALLHPSRNEACSMSIAEAMSLGLPTIGGRCTDGVPWQLDEGRAGVLVDVNDAEAMAEAIVALSRDRTRWHEISLAARARARQLFAVDSVVDQYLSLYATVLRTPGRASGGGRSRVSPAPNAGADLIMGLPISRQAPPEVLKVMEQGIARREIGRYISITNTESMYHGLRDEKHGAHIRNADFSLCDGVGVMVAGYAWGHRIERYNGPVLQLDASGHGLSRLWRHFFYGGKEGIAEEMARRLQERYPGLIVCGSYCPPFRELSPEEDQQVVDMINETRPDIVWVGLGLLKQERWIQQHLHRVRSPWMVGVGAAFDYHAGSVPWAPPLLRSLGLEWVFRLILQPKLRARRYWWSLVFVLESIWHGLVGLQFLRRRSPA